MRYSRLCCAAPVLLGLRTPVTCRGQKDVHTEALAFWFCRSTAARAERTAVLVAPVLPRLLKAPFPSLSSSTGLPPPPPPPSRCTPAPLPRAPLLPSSAAATPHRLRISLGRWNSEQNHPKSRHITVFCRNEVEVFVYLVKKPY